jgi:kumamolisin
VVDRLFHADVHRYRTTSGQTYVASNRDSTVPKPLRRLVVSAGRVSTVFIHTEAIPGGGFSPTGIMDAYDIRPLQRLGIDGAGQTIVFVEVDGVDESALSAYSQRFHLPPLNYTTYGPQLKPGPEATMDLEVVHAIAPRARLVVYNLPFADIFADLHRQLSQLIARSAGDIFSESLAICERSDTKQNAQALQSAYAQADAAGEAVFAATGDDAAFGCITQSNTAPVSSAVSAMIPAACPGVTAVGGTRLSVRGDGAWYDETVWEDPLQTEGTGGGPTRLYGRPSWQRAPGVSQQDSTYNTAGYRLLPDVSADADPASGMAIDIPQTGWTDGGGTSQATPIWAAITALIDQYLEQQHHHSLGWLNPALYSLARTPQAYPPFHDVTVGTNLVYPATKGYDMATGLGTPDAWFLAQDLAFYQKSHGR